MAIMDDLTGSFNKIDSSASVFFTYISSYINSLCDTVLSRVELFNATKDLYSIVGPIGNTWSPQALKRFAIGESELLSSDARIILALRTDVERTQSEFHSIIELLRDKFSKRHLKLKECAQVLETRDAKRHTDPSKEKRRLKKFESKLKPLRVEFQALTDALILALTDFKLSYLDWMEPLINAVAQMRLRHPDHIVDSFLKDSDLSDLRNEVAGAANKIHQAFEQLNTPELSWPALSQSLDALMRLPFAVPYFKRFAEQEQVSEGFGFWQEVKAYKQTSKTFGDSARPGQSNGQDPKPDPGLLPHARHILSLYIEEGSKQEINVPQSIKLSIIKQVKEGATEHLFDKALDAVAEMLEDSFAHFLTSSFSQQLQIRLNRIQYHHSRLQTTTLRIPQLNEADQDGASTDAEDTHSSGELASLSSPNGASGSKRPRSGSAGGPTTQKGIMKRSSSSSLIINVVADPADVASKDSRDPMMKSPSTAGKSNTAPIPSHSVTLRRHLVHADSSIAVNGRDVSPSGGNSARGMKSIVASLTGILAQKPKKDKKDKHKHRPVVVDDSDSESESTTLNLAFHQASELGPLATRQLCLLSAHFGNLVNQPKGADFIIQCGPEKVAFYCHSVIFNARWPMLMRENMRVMSDIAKGVEALIHLPTVDPEIFGLALEYIYTGSFNASNLTDRKLGLLTDFAKFRKVPGLKEMAKSHLLSRQPTARIVTAIAAYVQSSSSSGEMLRLDNDTKYESFMATLAARAQDLVELPLFDFHQLHRLRRIDMIHLIRRDDFSVSSEVQVFKLVTTWADKCSPDQDALMENISFLVAHVRLPLMTMEELQWIESLGWVPENLMREALKFKETGICNHPTRAKPRKLVWSPTSHSIDASSSSSSLLRFDGLTPTLTSLMTRSTASSLSSLRTSFRTANPLMGLSGGALDDSDDSTGPMLSPASTTSATSAASLEKDSHSSIITSSSASGKRKSKHSSSPKMESPIARSSAASPKYDSPLGRSSPKFIDTGSSSPGRYDNPLSPKSSSGSPMMSPKSDSPISMDSPSSPPLVRKEKKPKRSDTQESSSNGMPAPLKRANSSTNDIVKRHKKSNSKSKQDASPLTRADSPPGVSDN